MGIESDGMGPENDGAPEHGEPGHVCRSIDATDSLAGVVLFQHPVYEDRLVADSWSHGLTKRGAASILRQIADGWDDDADAEDAAASAAEASEAAAIERARTAGAE
jgi:hypothetical protein